MNAHRGFGAWHSHDRAASLHGLGMRSTLERLMGTVFHLVYQAVKRLFNPSSASRPTLLREEEEMADKNHEVPQLVWNAAKKGLELHAVMKMQLEGNES